MRFGMDIVLTKEEENLTASIVKPCFAALGLANDYYSFDIEWKEFQQEKNAEETSTMTNAVWLYIQWEDLSIDAAKEKVRQVVRNYEQEYQQQMNAFIVDKEQCPPHLAEYLRALAFQIPGNIVWSLRCPRYHPESCAEGDSLLRSGLDDKSKAGYLQGGRGLVAKEETCAQEDSDSEPGSPSSAGTPQCNPSSRTSVASLDLHDAYKPVHLGTEVRGSLLMSI